jgi:hypothetical protein
MIKFLKAAHMFCMRPCIPCALFARHAACRMQMQNRIWRTLSEARTGLFQTITWLNFSESPNVGFHSATRIAWDACAAFDMHSRGMRPYVLNIFVCAAQRMRIPYCIHES